MPQGSDDEGEQVWLGRHQLAPGARGASHQQRLDDGRLVLDFSVVDPWTWVPLLLMCRSCGAMSQTTLRIYRASPQAVDTSVSEPCSCGDRQVVPELYTVYDESTGRPYTVRNARRSTVLPTADTAGKFKRLSELVLAYERGEATDRDVVEAALQVDPAVSKRIKKWPSWLKGDWHKTAGVIIAALMVPPAYAAMISELRSEAAVVEGRPAEPAVPEVPPEGQGFVTLSVPEFLELLDKAAAAAEVSPPTGGTAPVAPPADPTSPTAP